MTASSRDDWDGRRGRLLFRQTLFTFNKPQTSTLFWTIPQTNFGQGVVTIPVLILTLPIGTVITGETWTWGSNVASANNIGSGLKTVTFTSAAGAQEVVLGPDGDSNIVVPRGGAIYVARPAGGAGPASLQVTLDAMGWYK